MRIIKAGRMEPEKTYFAKCLKCGCEYEFDRAEGYYSRVSDGTYVRITCKCPQCECINRGTEIPGRYIADPSMVPVNTI